MTDYELEDVAKAVLHHPDPVVTAADVADALDADVSRRTVLDDLRLLKRNGEVEKKKTGARAIAWWHVDRVTPAPPKTPDEHPDQAGFDDVAERVGDVAAVAHDADSGDSWGFDGAADGEPETSRHADTDHLWSRDGDGEIEDALREWRPGQGGFDREQRRSVGYRVVGWLRDRDEPATRSEFIETFFPEFQFDDQTEDSWWRRVAKPALDHARDAEIVEYRDGYKEYRWVGDDGSE